MTLSRLTQLVKRRRTPFVPNVAGEGGVRRALLSWIAWDRATDPDQQWHVNRRMTVLAAQALAELGYAVDAASMAGPPPQDMRGYDLVVGRGEPFRRALLCADALQRTHVHVAEMAHPAQRYAAELDCVASVRRARGTVMRPERLHSVPDFVSPGLADGIICTGNAWTLSTYADNGSTPVYRTPIPVRPLPYARSNAPESPPGADILWLGGVGAILKGLDTVLRALTRRPDLKLHVCGPLSEEVRHAFADELSQDNIVIHGFMDIRSAAFQKILSQCGYVLCAARSEAGCAAVLEAMSAGLIPIATTETSVDLDGIGVAVAEHTPEAVLSAVDAAMALPSEERARRSAAARDFICDKHSETVFRTALKAAVSRIDQDRNGIETTAEGV